MSEPLYRSRPGGFDIRPASEGTHAITDFIHVSEGLSNAYLVVIGSMDPGWSSIPTGSVFGRIQKPVMRPYRSRHLSGNLQGRSIRSLKIPEPIEQIVTLYSSG